MKTTHYFVLRSILALLLGILLVMWPGQVMQYLVLTIGALFLVPGLLSVIGYFMRKPVAGESRGMFPVAGVGSVLFGFWLMIMPGFFADIAMYLLGFILLMGGVQQLASLLSVRKYVPVPFLFYVLPVLLLGAGIVILFNPFKVLSTTLVVMGACSLVYGLSELFNGFRFYRRRPSSVEVIEVEEVKETD